MATMTPEEVHDAIVDGVSDCHPDNLEVDNEGQVLVHTGIYRWQDGSYHDGEKENVMGNPTCTCEDYRIEQAAVGREPLADDTDPECPTCN